MERWPRRGPQRVRGGRGEARAALQLGKAAERGRHDPRGGETRDSGATGRAGAGKGLERAAQGTRGLGRRAAEPERAGEAATALTEDGGEGRGRYCGGGQAEKGVGGGALGLLSSDKRRRGWEGESDSAEGGGVSPGGPLERELPASERETLRASPSFSPGVRCSGSSACAGHACLQTRVRCFHSLHV